MQWPGSGSGASDDDFVDVDVAAAAAVDGNGTTQYDFGQHVVENQVEHWRR